MNNTHKPYRAAVIGLGMGRAHAEAYAKLQDAELVALCDISEARLMEHAKRLNLPESACYTDYKVMLTEANLDIVSVALPNSLHAPVSIDLLNGGVNVICEKPLAISVADAQRMIDTAQANNKRLMVMYNKRYRADMQWIGQMIKQGKIGDVFHVNASWRRETGIPARGWFGDKTLAGGGPLFDLGVHVLDMVLWALDFPKVQTVSGHIRANFGTRKLKTWGDLTEDFTVEDGAVGFLRLAGDVSMFLQATWGEHANPGEDRLYVEIQGTEGTLIMDVPNYVEGDNVTYYTEINGTPSVVTPHINWNVPHGIEGFIQRTLEALRNDTPAPAEGDQGIITVGILEAIYESARTRREIAFDEIMSV